jgi:hypothetical protein
MTVELLFALIFGGILIYGLWNGRMPLRWFDLDRVRNPFGFWMGASFYVLLVGAFLVAAQ